MLNDIEFYWHGAPVSDLEAAMAEDIRREMPSLKKASDILIHVYCLADECDGPSIKMWGVDNDHRVHCEYSPVFAGMKFNIDDIPGMREKLIAAGHKFDDED